MILNYNFFKVNTFGKIKEVIKDNGKTIKWMEKVNLFGQMEELMRVSTRMIKSMVKAYLLGIYDFYFKKFNNKIISLFCF